MYRKAKQEQDAEEQKLAQQLEMTKERAVALYAEQDALYHTLEEKKQIFTQLRMDIEKIQQATKEEEETCQSLQERIIPSPDRLIRDRDAKLQDLANEQSESGQKQQQPFSNISIWAVISQIL